MNGWEKVRVRDHLTGAVRTTTRVRAVLDGHTILEDRPAVDENGQPLPPKPHTILNPDRDERGRFTKSKEDA
ncbi:hypothetical protein [Brachybacterium nesterenkovii]|uniref:hypothetical protein n=1 Tax=Brachybacterium nesterenkovii TaxID=47847 RepID=UPI00321B482F